MTLGDFIFYWAAGQLVVTLIVLIFVTEREESFEDEDGEELEISAT